MKRVWTVGLTVFAIWLLWAFQRLFLQLAGLDLSYEKVGQWGDSFGALNALFAAFAFLGVAITLVLQRQQIRSGQEDQHLQRFDTTYFELMSLLRETRNDVRFRHTKEFTDLHEEDGRRQTGTDAFRAAWHESLWLIEENGKELSRVELGRLYETKIHKRYEANFGPYFRLLYTILERIKTDPVQKERDRFRYANILRSQLTSFELALVGLNGLSPVSKDFSNLITEFRLLKYLPQGRRRTLLGLYYPVEAFSARD